MNTDKALHNAAVDYMVVALWLTTWGQLVRWHEGREKWNAAGMAEMRRMAAWKWN